jgi:hypothetical protein
MRPGFIAFAIACAFVGASLYITLVEQPARLELQPRAMLKEWTPSNRRGFMMTSVLALIASILADFDFARSGDVRLLIGGTIILASLPYAYFVIIPVNVLLYALPPVPTRSAARELMRDWGLLEWGQTALGLIACGFIGWTLVMPA